MTDENSVRSESTSVFPKKQSHASGQRPRWPTSKLQCPNDIMVLTSRHVQREGHRWNLRATARPTCRGIERESKVISLSNTSGNVSRPPQCRNQPFGRLPPHTGKSLFGDRQQTL